MAGTLHVADSIESSGFPLGFKVAQGTAPRPLAGMAAAQDILKVEVRAMGGHQKECVVTDGVAGSAWRMVCDEGAGLNGSDLAPFPLGFMSAGLQAELLGRIARLALARAVPIDSLRVELVNRYAFEGSFFRGTGRGSALAPAFQVHLDSPAPALQVRALVDAAAGASPLLAAVKSALANTFALYVNGQRRTPLQVLPSTRADAPDPLKSWRGVPQPLAGGGALAGMVAKLAPPPANTGPPRPAMRPDQDVQFAIEICGESHWQDGIAASETWAAKPFGSRFGLKSDERSAGDQAPSGLALAAAGVAFCLMTQLLRYSEFRKYQIRAVRIVQYWPMQQVLGADGAPSGTLSGTSGNLDTHVFLHGEETDENMGHLLLSSANTCYLHALLGAALQPEITLLHNGVPA